MIPTLKGRPLDRRFFLNNLLSLQMKLKAVYDSPVGSSLGPILYATAVLTV